MTHFGGVIIALKEEVKNTLCPRTPVYLQDKQPSIFAMKAVVYITELSTYFPEGSTFHLRICWIVIVITQYLRHFHRSYDIYLISFSFISLPLSTSFLVSFFFLFYSNDQVWVVWLPFLLTRNHCPFFATWEILGVEMEDGRQSWRLTEMRCILLMNDLFRI